MKAILSRKFTDHGKNPRKCSDPEEGPRPPLHSHTTETSTSALPTSSTSTASVVGSRSLRSIGAMARLRFRKKSSTSSVKSCSRMPTEVNGFSVEPDVNSLSMQAAGVAEFSIPQELLDYSPPEEAVVVRFKNGETERRIHCNTDLTQEELQKLGAMRDAAIAQDRVFSPHLARDATRYLGRARGDPKRAVREMSATWEWRREYFASGPVVDESLREDLASGIVYFSGRDHFLRPALVIRPQRIPSAWYSDKRASSERLVRLLIFCIEYMVRYMLLPGKVEGGVAIMDMSGLTLSQVPFGPLRSILTVLANHYVNRIFKFYLINLPSALNTTLQFGMRLLTERQRQKLQLVRSTQELREEFALHQLEEDLGGSRPSIDRFYPFPLAPGPFEAGWSRGPRLGAVPNLHEALPSSCFFGKVWNPSISREENTSLDIGEVRQRLRPLHLESEAVDDASPKERPTCRASCDAASPTKPTDGSPQASSRGPSSTSTTPTLTTAPNVAATQQHSMASESTAASSNSDTASSACGGRPAKVAAPAADLCVGGVSKILRDISEAVEIEESTVRPASEVATFPFAWLSLSCCAATAKGR